MTKDPERAALDANYNLRAAVPEFQDYFDRYDHLSEDFRSGAQGRLDLRYGSGPRQAIDLFCPATEAPPLAVFIHGGYWHSQDRKRFSFVARPLVEAGAAVALVGYDLAPEVDMDAIVSQIRAAIVWLWHHAPEHGYDRTRLALGGHSAGGHLAAMMLATDWTGHGLPRHTIKGACPISGIYDLDPIRRCYLDEVLALTPEQVRRHSPLRLAPATECPVTVVVGARETPAFLEQSRRYADHLQTAGLPCELVQQDGLDHFGIVLAMSEPDSPAVGALRTQLGL